MSSEIGVSPTQMRFLDSERDFSLFCGGLGSGKTFAGALWAIRMLLSKDKSRGLITANSYSQLKKASLVTFFELMDKFQIPYTYNKNEGVVYSMDKVIYTISMENYDTLRGIEVGWCWSDECAFYKEEAFNVLIGRIRDNRGLCQWKGTTTPNGFNWLYEKFVEDPLDRSEVFYAKTEENAKNLAESYISTLKKSYDSVLSKQELDGQFVNLNSGKVYYGFDRDKHVQPCSSNSRYIFVGLDFNVHPLCGVYCVEEDGKIKIVEELYLENSNTFQAAKKIVSRFPTEGVNVIADETGNRRKSSSSYTDHEILRRANLHVLRFKNPYIKDRQNNMNRLFEQGKIVIDPKCKYLIKDLEQLVRENKDEMLGHITDALGYVCWHLDPLMKPKTRASVSYL